MRFDLCIRHTVYRHVVLTAKALLLSIGTLILLAGNQSSLANTLPNILIFMGDDLTYTDIGPYGSEQVHTPHLDQFAQQGLKFNYAFSSSAMCAPTRMELYTGIQPVRNGGHPNHSRVYDNIRSMPNYLRPLGYRVGILGKRHEAPQKNIGFEFIGGNTKKDKKGKAIHKSIDLKLAKQFIEKTQGPWALVVASRQPHGPWNLGDRSRYDPDQIQVPADLVDTPETRKALSLYFAETTFLDSQFGQVLAYLKASGKEKDTLVLFLTEQGSTFPFAKWTLYENGVRAGVIARWPGKIKPATTTDAMIQYTDVLPTLIEIAGQSSDKMDFDGRSFANVLYGKTKQHRKYSFAAHTTNGILNSSKSYPIRSVRDQRYRLIWNLDYKAKFQNIAIAKGGPAGTFKSWIKLANNGDIKAKERVESYQYRPEFELYDIDQDPLNLNNLANNKNYSDIQENLFKELKNWMKQQGDKGLATEADAPNRKRSRASAKYELGIPAGSKTLDWRY